MRGGLEGSLWNDTQNKVGRDCGVVHEKGVLFAAGISALQYSSGWLVGWVFQKMEFNFPFHMRIYSRKNEAPLSTNTQYSKVGVCIRTWELSQSGALNGKRNSLLE